MFPAVSSNLRICWSPHTKQPGTSIYNLQTFAYLIACEASWSGVQTKTSIGLWGTSEPQQTKRNHCNLFNAFQAVVWCNHWICTSFVVWAPVCAMYIVNMKIVWQFLYMPSAVKEAWLSIGNAFSTSCCAASFRTSELFKPAHLRSNQFKSYHTHMLKRDLKEAVCQRDTIQAPKPKTWPGDLSWSKVLEASLQTKKLRHKSESKAWGSKWIEIYIYISYTYIYINIYIYTQIYQTDWKILKAGQNQSAFCTSNV